MEALMMICVAVGVIYPLAIGGRWVLSCFDPTLRGTSWWIIPGGRVVFVIVMVTVWLPLLLAYDWYTEPDHNNYSRALFAFFWIMIIGALLAVAGAVGLLLRGMGRLVRRSRNNPNDLH